VTDRYSYTVFLSLSKVIIFFLRQVPMTPSIYNMLLFLLDLLPFTSAIFVVT
jgi:hypothetical protein